MSLQSGPYYSRQELLSAGFSKVGQPLWFSRKASLYAVEGSLGDHVRVDDFCIFKGRVEIGSYVHVAAYCSLSGVGGGVEIGDCASLGNRCSLYSGSDDYRADGLAGNLVPQELVHRLSGRVRLGTAALVGAHCVILPGVSVGDAASVGAQCVLQQDVEAGAIVVGAAARSLCTGHRDVAKILGLARALLGRA